MRCSMCMAALHKKCFPSDQKSSIVLAADAHGGFSSQCRRTSCSPLEVLITFTLYGPRFSVGPFFLLRSPIARSSAWHA